MKPGRMLIAVGTLWALLLGAAALDATMNRVCGYIDDARGNERPGECIPAAERFVRSVLPVPDRAKFYPPESGFNKTLRQWYVTGKFNDFGRDREYLCRMKYSGLRWQCTYLLVDNSQRYPQEDTQ